jgi:hypothetical protein
MRSFKRQLPINGVTGQVGTMMNLPIGRLTRGQPQPAHKFECWLALTKVLEVRRTAPHGFLTVLTDGLGVLGNSLFQVEEVLGEALSDLRNCC